MTDPRFPIGEFRMPNRTTPAERDAAMESIDGLPSLLADAVGELMEQQLDTPYRSGGWTVRQVTHHLPDSHINAYLRMKLGLTEDEPLIRTYEEARWAELADAGAPVELSLRLLTALHARWVFLFRALREEQWQATFRHPDLGVMNMKQLAAFYAWHGEHHVAHITTLRERMGW